MSVGDILVSDTLLCDILPRNQMIFKSHIKLSVLKELSERDCSGYDLMSAIGLFGGKKPSPGYIYPLLKELNATGHVRVHGEDRKKMYHITERGKSLLFALEKNHKDMTEKMLRVFRPIANKRELAKMKNFQKEVQRHKPFFAKNKDVIAKLYRTFISFSDEKDEIITKKVREILKDSAKKLEELKKISQSKKDLSTIKNKKLNL
jgi:DNA-binding PadR family transcriptional regulator